MPVLAPENRSVQFPLVKYAAEIGWTVLPPDEALKMRKGEGGMLLRSVLREQLLALNPGVVNEGNVDEIVGKLDSVRADIEGNAEVLDWVRGKKTVYVQAEKRQRNVVLVDFEDPARNIFHVSTEWDYTNGQHNNRADVMFVVNGVPVALVETKRQGRRDALDDGFKQVRRYHAETPELLATPQVFDVNQIVDFYYGPTWNLDRKALFNWKDEEAGNFERKVKRFFDRTRFLRMLGEWIVFFRKDDELRKIVLRQHQTRAVDKVVERVFDKDRRRGLVWHTQGSGKTFTMIKAAERILRPGGEKPTVLMLVDRNELQSQLFDNLRAYGLDYEVATSKARLRELLRRDHRGLIVSMIHKFDKADADLCTRDNVIVLVDEAHRSTGADLGNYLVGALPKATLIGFTGTPIDRTAHGGGTFKTFGVDDRNGYLDKYSMRESIEDGTTLPLRYSLAPNDIRVPRDQLESEFLSLAEAEGIADVEELNRILDRAVNLKNFLKGDDRVAKVAAFVAEHFRTNVDPLGYKAFLVGVDREACALYKKALDAHFPRDWSTVVYTSAHNDEPPLSDYRLEDAEEKRVRKLFARPEALPKILIVTEKLLTGFDAPILYCMYLDKPMRDHTLLQAIARVNRPWENEAGKRKPSGFVVDFVGIFEKLNKALAFDADEVEANIVEIDVLRERFQEMMRSEARPYLKLCRKPLDDKGVERVLEHFSQSARREVFFKFFEELEELYEVLSPDAFLRPFIDDYGRLAGLKELVADIPGSKGFGYRDLAEKTALLVREHVQSYGLRSAGPPVSIDEKTLEAMKHEADPKASRVLNLARSLKENVEKAGGEQPFLVPIADRTDAVLEQFSDRQISTQEALHQLEQLVEEFLSARAEQKTSGLQDSAFTLYWALKRDGVPKARDLAIALDASFRRFPIFRDNAEAMRSLKADLYKLLLPGVGKAKMVALADRLIGIWRPSAR
jgi:type I restriction enzyme R subunit